MKSLNHNSIKVFISNVFFKAQKLELNRVGLSISFAMITSVLFYLTNVFFFFFETENKRPANFINVNNSKQTTDEQQKFFSKTQLFLLLFL